MTRTSRTTQVAVAVAANFALVLWHLALLQHVYPPGPGFNIPTLGITVGVCSLAGVLMLWTRFAKFAACFIIALLLIALVTGGGEHFVFPGPFNVFYLTPNDWAAQFDVSAALLAVVEIVGLWLAFRVIAAKS